LIVIVVVLLEARPHARDMRLDRSDRLDERLSGSP